METSNITFDELIRKLDELIEIISDEYERTVQEDEAVADELEAEEVEYNKGWAGGMANALGKIRGFRRGLLG